MLRCYRNHSAFNSHNLPSDLRYYLPALLFTSRPTRGHCWFGNYLVTSGCTYGLGTVSFHSISFEVYFAAVSAQGFARASPPFGGSRCHHRYGLLATHLAIVYPVYSAYLPGLPLRVPRRLWKVMDSNHRAFQLTALCRSCLCPLSQPSCSVCRYAIATLTLTASCWSSLTTLHLSFVISPDAIIL